MVATAAAIAGILGTAYTVGSGIAGQMSRGGSNSLEQQKLNQAQQQLADARDNEQYQRMVGAMINQRSVAGQTDSMGNKLEYDPSTNTWRSTAGALPQAAQTAAEQAGISRNTTDLRQAQLANAIAARRATEAGPVADTAVRELQSFRPQGADQLVGLLQAQGTNAARATFDPLRADTLRSFQRSGTAAGPVLAQLGKSENDALRDTLIDAQIKGMTGVGGINQAKRQGLEQSAANAMTLATPQFQYPGIQPRTDDMAKTVAARAASGAYGTAQGMGGVNTAAGGVQAAGRNLQGAYALPSNSLTEAGKTIGSTLKDKELFSNLSTLFGSKPFDPNNYAESSNPLLDYASQAQNLESAFGSNNPSSGLTFARDASSGSYF